MSANRYEIAGRFIPFDGLNAIHNTQAVGLAGPAVASLTGVWVPGWEQLDGPSTLKAFEEVKLGKAKALNDGDGSAPPPEDEVATPAPQNQEVSIQIFARDRREMTTIQIVSRSYDGPYTIMRSQIEDVALEAEGPDEFYEELANLMDCIPFVSQPEYANFDWAETEDSNYEPESSIRIAVEERTRLFAIAREAYNRAGRTIPEWLS